MKKLLITLAAALMLFVSCAASPQAPRVLESCMPEVYEQVKKNNGNMMDILSIWEVEIKPGHFARLEIYDFDNNGTCDQNNLDGGVLFAKDPQTNNQWVLYELFDCANAKIVRDNIINIKNGKAL